MVFKRLISGSHRTGFGKGLIETALLLDDSTENLLCIIPRPPLRIESPSKFQINLDIGFCVFRIRGLVYRLKALETVSDTQSILLCEAGYRQNDICERHDRGLPS